jgi:hypothetical protein
MLLAMIKRAKNDGQIERVIPHLVDGGLSILDRLMYESLHVS